MASSTSRLWILVPSLLGLASLRCSVGGVGDPCVPEDEYQIAFSGYSVEEVNVESRSFQCETRVCLVNHFQGRVSCPYGQGQTTDALASCVNESNPFDAAGCCKIPGTTGQSRTDRVLPAVSPQLQGRQTDRAVYCSCRCANVDGKTNDGKKYCTCPSGYSCTQLIPNLGASDPLLAGSYCIKSGTGYKATDKSGLTCDPTTKNCGPLQPD
jgi:hypothetical protein